MTVEQLYIERERDEEEGVTVYNVPTHNTHTHTMGTLNQSPITHRQTDTFWCSNNESANYRMTNGLSLALANWKV